MEKITIVGTGKVGALVALLLQQSGKYELQLISQDFSGDGSQRLFKLYPALKSSVFKMDITEQSTLNAAVKKFQPDALISCLPFFLTKHVAVLAKQLGCNYFDLTEDVTTAAFIRQLAADAKSAFVPQCGLAPGMAGLIANDLMRQFTEVESVQLRVGALPQFSNHGLKYALTWSTDGLINEYDQLCRAILDGKERLLSPLEHLESIELLGEQFEAFNTSGGLGSLVDICEGKVQNLTYKTIRYRGHCEKMRFLMRDLKLKENKKLLKSILENAVPRSYQDFVLIAIQVTGTKDGQLQSQGYIKKILPESIAGFDWSALQISTAAGLCAVVDVVLSSKTDRKGLIYQEQISMNDILKTPFANCYLIES